MKRYKLIEVVQNGATSKPADVETWGVKQHVLRINELAADGWSIYTIHAHGDALYVYLEKETRHDNGKRYYAAEVTPGVWAVYNSKVLEIYCESEKKAISLAEKMNDNYEKGDQA